MTVAETAGGWQVTLIFESAPRLIEVVNPGGTRPSDFPDIPVAGFLPDRHITVAGHLVGVATTQDGLVVGFWTRGAFDYELRLYENEGEPSIERLRRAIAGMLDAAG